MKDEQRALDILQECIFKGFLNIEKLKHPQFFKTWITKVLINVAITYIKKESQVVYLDHGALDKPQDVSIQIVDKLDLYDAIDRLRENYKTVIILKYFNDMSIDEHTFVGVQQFDLASLGNEIPDEFVFQTKINRIENAAINAGDRSDVIKGTWAFKVHVTVNKELKKVIKIDGVSTNDIRVDSISMTPFSTRVNATILDEEPSRYDIYIFDDHGNKLRRSQVKNRSNNQFEYIYNAIEPSSNHLRIVGVKQIWDKNSEDTYTHNENEVLLDTTISLVDN